MRLKRFFKSQSFKVYTMELFIVILGISIAYQLNIFNERRINRNLELNVIKNLEKEIQINITEFQSLSAYRERITRDSDRFLTLLKKSNIPKDSAEKYVFKLIQTSTPDLQQQATSSYINSNYGSSNVELKNELLALETYFQELLDLSEGYKDRKHQDYVIFLRTSVDFLERKVLKMKTIESVEFKNIVWNLATDEYELNRLYGLASGQLNKVDSLITQIIASNQ